MADPAAAATAAWRWNCPGYDQAVLAVEGHGLFDPDPGEGGHYDTVLTEDLSRVVANGGQPAAAYYAEGRLPLYRAHKWSCPE